MAAWFEDMADVFLAGEEGYSGRGVRGGQPVSRGPGDRGMSAGEPRASKAGLTTYCIRSA
jgi:hypothetical protein